MKLKLMKNKKGELVLRNIIFMIIIFSGIIALSSIFVNQMGETYVDYTNMSSSYNQDTIGSSQLNETGSKWEEIAENLQGNVFEMLLGTLKAAGEIIKQVIIAPVTFSNMLTSILEDFGVEESITNVLGFILTSVLYILIAFAIVTAFLKGGKI